jgi:hypothetical protein
LRWYGGGLPPVDAACVVSSDRRQPSVRARRRAEGNCAAVAAATSVRVGRAARLVAVTAL